MLHRWLSENKRWAIATLVAVVAIAAPILWSEYKRSAAATVDRALLQQEVAMYPELCALFSDAESNFRDLQRRTSTVEKSLTISEREAQFRYSRLRDILIESSNLLQLTIANDPSGNAASTYNSIKDYERTELRGIESDLREVLHSRNIVRIQLEQAEERKHNLRGLIEQRRGKIEQLSRSIGTVAPQLPC